jgi:hypothetical protein
MTIEPPTEKDAGAPEDTPIATPGNGVKDDLIRERAYIIWIDEGRPDGREVDHWMRAKWELERDPNPSS